MLMVCNLTCKNQETHVQRLVKLVDIRNQKCFDLNKRYEIKEISYLSQQILHILKFKEELHLFFGYTLHIYLCWYAFGVSLGTFLCFSICVENGTFPTIFRSNYCDR